MSQSEPRRCHTASSNWLKIMRNQEELSASSSPATGRPSGTRLRARYLVSKPKGDESHVERPRRDPLSRLPGGTVVKGTVSAHRESRGRGSGVPFSHRSLSGLAGCRAWARHLLRDDPQLGAEVRTGD